MSEPKTVKSTCCYCGVGCGILVTRGRDGKVTVKGDPDHPVNRGMLCSKGLNLHHTVMDTRDRLTVPRMRDSRAHPLRDVTWDEALDRAAAVFRSLIARHGPDSVAFYISGQCLTEEYYVFNKLMKGFIGSNNIDTNSRLCMSSAVVGYKMALGEDSVPGCYEDIELADCWLVAGANPAWCHPILFRRLEERRQGPNRGRLIVVDPRRTQTASEADLHLAPWPGTDVALLRALARLLIENGFEDKAFVDAHTEGYDEFRAEVFSQSVEEYADLCGVPVAELELAAQWIGESSGFVSLWAMGLNQSVQGVEKNLALINLHLVTGRIGKPGNGPFSLTGQPNAMGGREVGGLSNLLPAHRNLAEPKHRLEVAKFWGSTGISEKPGLTATEMIDALNDGRLKAVWIACTNPLVSLPDLNRVEAALKNARFVVVQDISSRADTLAYADLVLPAATWAEKAGTMTNSERRVSRLAALVPPPGQALPDAEIMTRFARKMGWGAAFDYPSVSDIFDEHVRLTKGTNIDISGLTALRLSEQTFQWPVPDQRSGGTPRLFADGKFPRPNGRARLHTSGPLELRHQNEPGFPLVLTTGRVRDQWHTMTRTGKVAKLGRHEPESFLEIHPDDAAERGIADGALTAVESRSGTTVVRARVTDGIRPGVVFLPMHWGRQGRDAGARANNVTEARLDPRSKQPDLKYQAVEVRLHRPQQRRIVVVGAGAASAEFVRALRREGSEDIIAVLSKEPNPYYNRVQLPHYLEGTHSWESLVTLSLEERRLLGVTVYEGTAAAAIDRAAQTVTDQHGGVHRYDVLVLATGSRAALPKVAGGDLPGVFGLRTREDADALLMALETGGPLVVVGGGVLALEVAGAFHLKNAAVTLVHRSARLMDRQLDETASRLLAEELADRGLPLIFHDEVVRVEGHGKVEAVVLASGRRLAAAAVVFGTGTAPNIELARAAGLAVGRGVTVDDRMVTSDPRILALGEIAEFEGQSWGITPAAEEQARAAAGSLAGDPFARYHGSTSVNVLKLGGLNLASVGRLTTDHPRAETIVFLDEALRTYKKVLLEDDRVVGALLLGEKAEFAALKQLIDSGLELGETRRTLLRSGSVPQEGTGRLVCSCNSVRESTLTEAAAAGAGTVEALMTATGAGTGCGSCRPELARFCALKAEAVHG
jgi:ferredoxin-nitrate reductase